jgi:hypothetical protein
MNKVFKKQIPCRTHEVQGRGADQELLCGPEANFAAKLSEMTRLKSLFCNPFRRDNLERPPASAVYRQPKKTGVTAIDSSG